ncbi:MAG: LuxR C-terminal-related transcriptional regulator [Janthinobacterium lividum]
MIVPPPAVVAAALGMPRPDLRRRPATDFTARELEVLRLVVADLSNRDIANRLFVSVRTVESHRRALLQKAGARTAVGLAVRAVRAGWVGPPAPG